MTNDGRTTIDTVEILRLKGIFDRNYNFSVQIKKSEHALGLCLDMKPFVRGQVDGHMVIRPTFGEKVIVIPKLSKDGMSLG